jgi:FixJ family two-component response regulator
MAKAKAAPAPSVAVVEDDAGVRRALQNLLSSAAIRSRGFCAAEGFLRAKPSPRFGCLVIDVTLPGMSGVALHEHLLRSGIAIPTVFVTADEKTVARALRGGRKSNVVAILSKPPRDTEFLRAVRAALRGSQRALMARKRKVE